MSQKIDSPDQVMKNNSQTMNNNHPEKMDDFFDRRATGYDDHMEGAVTSFASYYQSIADPVIKTNKEIRVLDLGCGTGTELKGILLKAPRAKIIGIDLSQKMIDLLLQKYQDHQEQIEVRKGSYLDLNFEQNSYDYIISVMTVHHLLYQEKLNLYRKIYAALKDGGKYIEGDYVVSQEKADLLLAEYHQQIKIYQLEGKSNYHLDIPFSLETEEQLFEEAGFKDFVLVWHQDEAAIYYGQK